MQKCYCFLVSTWDGSKPEVNREVEREKLTASYRNGWYDGYEQEIDEGRVSQKDIRAIVIVTD